MKLQKKKLTNIKVLGEIVSYDEYGCIAVKTEQGVVWYYRSLAELNEEWEDYEEPKTFFTIYYDGTISEFNGGDDEQIRDMKEIGNYFETREEAKKAVKKIEAITRLSKCGFRFEGYTDRDRANGGDIVIYAHVNIPNNNLLEEAQPAMLKDLDLVFGGE